MTNIIAGALQVNKNSTEVNRRISTFFCATCNFIVEIYDTVHSIGGMRSYLPYPAARYRNLKISSKAPY